MKVAIITGGSRGLGKSAALKMAEKGIGVILTYQRQEGAAREVVEQITKAGGKAVALPLDVGQVKTFGAFAERVKLALREVWGKERFDILVNNAGTGVHAPVSETTEEQFDELVNVHFKGVFFLTQKLMPLIADGGRIVNISSGLTRFTIPGYGAYASMKGAIEVLTRYLAKELGSRQITVNTLAPGATETDFGGGMVRDNKELNRMLASTVALGRVGLPDDIGSAIASLVTDDNHWVNAQRIEASGGTNI